MSDASQYEQLGTFYLGRHVHDGVVSDQPLLYDAKDLTTHAVCVGMTGSGKTGLCVCLLEEAAIDAVPAIVVDLKGDLTNLLLTFEDLDAAAFLPWMDHATVARAGRTPEEAAAAMAERWRNGLADWDQDAGRIARLRKTTDLALYTPGGSFGRPLSILRSLAAPPAAVREDADAFRERIMATVSGLLTLLGLDDDPVQSRDHILLSTILEHAWQGGQNLALSDLIRQIQAPPFNRIGVFDLDTFYPAKERMKLAMTINNLLASPAFAAWSEGEPLDVPRLLWTPAGRPRLSVLYLAHLGEAERMFFLTLLLNEVVAWMRTQSGTGSLRALLYIDEVFGYLPPVGNPPSKTPLLTLLKQARAYGLGLVLSTQNPVDLDYKALSNAGTWFLGRLQTERDKMRVLDGLEGVSHTAGGGFDRQAVEATLSGLGKRIFYLHNVHDTAPALFHTRWALSYLAGPLTRDQVQQLAGPPPPAAPPASPAAGTAPAAPAPPPSPPAAPPPRPLLPTGLEEVFFPVERRPPPGARLLYRPYLFAVAHLHYAKRGRPAVDTWETAHLVSPWAEIDWREASTVEPAPTPYTDQAAYADLVPAPKAAALKEGARALKDHLYRERRLTLFQAPLLAVVSEPGETEGAFRVRLRQAAHEHRDREVEKLRTRYASKMDQLERQVGTAEDRVERETAQMKTQSFQAAVDIGSRLLGLVLGGGRKATALRSSARGVGRAAREKGDVDRAKNKLEEVQERLDELERELEQEVEDLRAACDPEAVAVETVEVSPRKSDLTVEDVRLAWVPFVLDEQGPPTLATTLEKEA